MNGVKNNETCYYQAPSKCDNKMCFQKIQPYWLEYCSKFLTKSALSG